MIDVVSPHDYGAYRAELRQMFRLRYHIFKERLGWDVNGVNGEERDEFDDCEPYYLLARDHRGAVVGTWRMLPTTGPYMLKDVFDVLLEGAPVPASPRIWEGSRFAVAALERDRNGLSEPSRITSEIFCGVTEFCLAMGIREVLTVYDIRLSRILPRAGCLPKARSRGHRIGNTISVMARFEMTETFLDRLRRAGNITGSVIRSAPWLDVPKVA